MDEDKQPPEPHHLAEDLDTLVLQLAHIVSDARQIRARTGEALHETGGDRIAHVDKYPVEEIRWRQATQPLDFA
jgi:hypothetical protein